MKWILILALLSGCAAKNNSFNEAFYSQKAVKVSNIKSLITPGIQ